MFPLLPLLKPVAGFLLGEAFKLVFKAEHKSNVGANKLSSVISSLSSAAKTNGMTIEPKELVRLVKAIVALCNKIGLFDDKPGLDFSDLIGIIETVSEVVQAVIDLVD